jgi:WD repeat-containing protein 68
MGRSGFYGLTKRVSATCSHREGRIWNDQKFREAVIQVFQASMASDTSNVQIRHPESSIQLDWPAFALSMSSPFSQETRLAVASFNRSRSNVLRVYRLVGPSLIAEGKALLEFPQTSCQFAPHPNLGGPTDDILVSVGDSLRLWDVSSSGLQLLSDILVNATADPLTCSDWSPYERSIVVAGSTDGTAAAIDLTENDVVTRVIAHDHPVHDISFADAATFVTAGFDGSVRFFDLRDLQSSFIFYQSSFPLMRARVSPSDGTKIAAFSNESKTIVMIDSRRPGVPCALGSSRPGELTGIGWEKLGIQQVYASDSTGMVQIATLQPDIPRLEEQGWYKAADPVESLAVGQGVIAIAHGSKVDIVEGFKLRQSTKGMLFS